MIEHERRRSIGAPPQKWPSSFTAMYNSGASNGGGAPVEHNRVKYDIMVEGTSLSGSTSSAVSRKSATPNRFGRINRNVLKTNNSLDSEPINNEPFFNKRKKRQNLRTDNFIL